MESNLKTPPQLEVKTTALDILPAIIFYHVDLEFWKAPWRKLYGITGLGKGKGKRSPIAISSSDDEDFMRKSLMSINRYIDTSLYTAPKRGSSQNLTHKLP